MSKKVKSAEMKWSVSVLCLALVFLFLQPGGAFAGTKLFWFDCGPGNGNNNNNNGGGNNNGGNGNGCGNASVWYVDPSAATPTPTLFDSGVAAGQDPKTFEIPTGTINLTTYQISNVQASYVFYLKNGKIWLVNTSTLAKTQLSNETGATTDAVCEINSNADLITPANSVITYRLKGPDGQCYTGDDVTKAVTLGMTATSTPKNLGAKQLQDILFDGSYFVFNFGSNPFQVMNCTTGMSCTTVTTFGNNAWEQSHDAKQVIFGVDNKIMSYNYVAKSLATLYTMAVNETASDVKLDRDGFVYFSTITTASPYTNAVKKVPVGGGTVTTMKSFTTVSPLPFLWIEISPSYVVYEYPNSAFSAENIYSIAKSGGTTVLLSNADIGIGGIVGSYFFGEDTAGNVHKMKLDGTSPVVRTKSQLNCASLGGAADWTYRFNPSTFRGFITSLGNVVKSYAATDDISNSAVGTVIGTLPVNMHNFNCDTGMGLNLLATGGKRSAELSYGQDVLLMKATTASSLKRLTNTNGNKVPLDQIH